MPDTLCSRSDFRGARHAIAALLLCAACACRGIAPDTTLERLIESRRLTSDLLVQLTKSADAGNRAVMAQTEEASAAFVGEAEQAAAVIQRGTEALRPALQSLGYRDEARLLDEFGKRFTEYRAVDRTLLDLTAENTNLKAQRLSFGAASQAAEAFRDALAGLSGGDAAPRVEAAAALAIAAVREIQVLQAPHIAEADDAAMTEMEKRMAASEAAARGALRSLAPLVPPSAAPRLAQAAAALDRFMMLNAEIVILSRRNTNVRSLALSLGQRRMLTAGCEESLQALQDALAKRSLGGTR
jgi:hypothetical protein